jgi:nicotinate-nucleotide adenylyltransferase
MSEARSLSRVGVMGGTFDPIHVGHLIAGTEALHDFQLDLIVFVPTGRPWQKKDYSNPEDRFMMTLLGTAAHQSFAVSRMELDRRGLTYTADTMKQLRDLYGDRVDFFFIAGADAILQLGTWERLDELKDLTEMIAVTRPGFDLDAFKPQPGWPRVHQLTMPYVDVSASEIRERVRMGKPIDYLVPAAVRDYIRTHALYTAPAETPRDVA